MPAELLQDHHPRFSARPGCSISERGNRRPRTGPEMRSSTMSTTPPRAARSGCRPVRSCRLPQLLPKSSCRLDRRAKTRFPREAEDPHHARQDDLPGILSLFAPDPVAEPEAAAWMFTAWPIITIYEASGPVSYPGSRRGSAHQYPAPDVTFPRRPVTRPRPRARSRACADGVAMAGQAPGRARSLRFA